MCLSEERAEPHTLTEYSVEDSYGFQHSKKNIFEEVL